MRVRGGGEGEEWGEDEGWDVVWDEVRVRVRGGVWFEVGWG